MDVVQGVRALRVAGDFGDLPRCEVAVNVFGELLAFFAELVNFLADVYGRFGLHIAQLFNFVFELCNGLLKI